MEKDNNEQKQEKKVIKISLKQLILIFVLVIIVIILGGNLFAYLNGKPNIYSAIKGLFIKEENSGESIETQPENITTKVNVKERITENEYVYVYPDEVEGNIIVNAMAVKKLIFKNDGTFTEWSNGYWYGGTYSVDNDIVICNIISSDSEWHNEPENLEEAVEVKLRYKEDIEGLEVISISQSIIKTHSIDMVTGELEGEAIERSLDEFAVGNIYYANKYKYQYEIEKSYTAYYLSGTSDSAETVKIYEDNTVTVQIAEHAKESFSANAFDEPSILEANKEYEVTGINSNISRVTFLCAVRGGAYIGSCIFFGTENNELYLLDMYKAHTEGNTKAVKVAINDLVFMPEGQSIREDGYEKIIMVIADRNGNKFIIERDGTLTKYVEKTENTEPEENNNKQTQLDTDAQAKESIEKFLKFYGGLEADSLGALKVLNIDAERDEKLALTFNNRVYYNTRKTETYFYSEISKFMTIEMLNMINKPNANSDFEYFISYEGMLYVAASEATGASEEIIEFERMHRNGNEYSYNVTTRTQPGNSEEAYNTVYYITVIEKDGNMIVSHIGVG